MQKDYHGLAPAQAAIRRVTHTTAPRSPDNTSALVVQRRLPAAKVNGSVLPEGEEKVCKKRFSQACRAVEG